MATKILKKYKHDMPLIFNSMGHLIYTHTHTQERGGGGGYIIVLFNLSVMITALDVHVQLLGLPTGMFVCFELCWMLHDNSIVCECLS